jgi:hypothetical protein
MDNPRTDRNNILRHIDDFTSVIGHPEVQVDSHQILEVCLRIREKFPHVDGLEKASVFKKAANFVAHFLEVRPIKSELQVPIRKCSSTDMNAVIAFDIAMILLEHCTIVRDDGDTITVDRPLYVSNHSYADIIEALSSEHITQKTHYHMLSVFFEQLTYKTNPQCEYRGSGSTDDTYSAAGYYPLVEGGDDLYGV